ncbi:MAG: glucokinase [Methyloceanibacter sp.]|uniref:glucokinase n=1 Tax=Methyloceanibacter sp. TaxID=1965321 RepID=UPI001D765589|nr:glucokinase [Methyloceanibacter sp.]MCB1443431.1 glucokinase [Methyloceanibacter sp.]MCC0058536.1 glucokinase [Hyphomicrobiaceae bacterium]
MNADIPTQALVADIGGTNARFAIANLETLSLSDIRTFPTAEHATLADAIRAYLKDAPETVAHAGLAVAAPLREDTVKFTNAAWTFKQSTLAKEAGLEAAYVFNDFEAQAYALPVLSADELHSLHGGKAVENAPKVVLGPGTGLGVAGLVRSPSGWVPVPGEGGHQTFPAENERELALLERMRVGLERLSVERVLSGPGLADLYRAIAASYGFSDAGLSPAKVEQLAIGGEDEMAVEALNFFVQWLGRFAGDMALVFGARGGVYLGGGIAPKMLSRLEQDDFRQAFERKGRMSPYVEAIPIHVIVSDYPGLKGAAAGLRTKLSIAG